MSSIRSTLYILLCLFSCTPSQLIYFYMQCAMHNFVCFFVVFFFFFFCFLTCLIYLLVVFMINWIRYRKNKNNNKHVSHTDISFIPWFVLVIILSTHQIPMAFEALPTGCPLPKNVNTFRQLIFLTFQTIVAHDTLIWSRVDAKF